MCTPARSGGDNKRLVMLWGGSPAGGGGQDVEGITRFQRCAIYFLHINGETVEEQHAELVELDVFAQLIDVANLLPEFSVNLLDGSTYIVCIYLDALGVQGIADQRVKLDCY